PLTSSPSTGYARISIYPSAGSVPLSQVRLTGHDHVFGLGWADADAFWMLDEAEGLLLVDAQMLELAANAGIAADLDTATILRFPDLLGAYFLRSDPFTGDVWVSHADVWECAQPVAVT